MNEAEAALSQAMHQKTRQVKLRRRSTPSSAADTSPILRRTALGWATLEAATLEVATLKADALQAVQVEAAHHEVGCR